MALFVSLNGKSHSVIEIVSGLFCLVVGIFLVLMALQGAHIIPGFMLRDGTSYTAFQAVGTLLIGQALIAAATYVLWVARRSFQGR